MHSSSNTAKSLRTLRTGALAGLLFAGTLGAAACSSDVGSDESFHTDSFSTPTEHGELTFGTVPNAARFNDQERFHSWTFSLSDSAALDLKINLKEVNLDTVLYLYRRDTETGNWGSYIKKNDNFDGELWSRVQGDFKAGEYRVKVKATHVRMVGGFEIEAACSGAGCPETPGGACEAEIQHGYTASCGGRIMDVLSSDPIGENMYSYKYSDRCALGGPEAMSISHYHDQWTEWSDWEDVAYEDEVNVSVSKLDKGTIVEIDLGGDEDTFYYVWDANDELLYYHHSEQSSTTYYTCVQEGDATVTEPDTEECGGALIYYAPSGPSYETTNGTTSSDAAVTDVGELAAHGVKRFVTALGLSNTDSIGYELEKFEESEILTVTANDTSTQMVLANRWGYDPMILTETPAGGQTEIVCENFE